MKKDILAGVVAGASMLLFALAAKYAHGKGYIDGDAVLRVVAMNGLLVAYLGNQLPNAVVPYAWARQSRRFSGWTLVLSGLVFAGLWIFAPIPVAVTFGTVAVLGGVILSLGYCVWLRGRTATGA